MNNPMKDLINGLGAIAETLGIMRTNLMKQGFTRHEAVQLCNTMLAMMMPQQKAKSADDE